MAGMTAAAQDAMLNALAGLVTHLSLHTSDPGTAGSSEVFGGSPQYRRLSAPWAAARNGLLRTQARVVFDVPGGTTVSHIGYWGGLGRDAVFYGSRPLDSAQTFASQGTFTVESGDISERTV